MWVHILLLQHLHSRFSLLEILVASAVVLLKPHLNTAAVTAEFLLAEGRHERH